MLDQRNSRNNAIALILILFSAASILAINRQHADQSPRPHPTANLNPFTAWKRISDTPILAPQDNDWESAGTFNPAVIFVSDKSNATAAVGGKFVMLYRAQDKAGT